MSLIERAYRILDAVIVLRVSRCDFLDRFDLDFAPFAVPSSSVSPSALRLEFRLKSNGSISFSRDGIFYEEVAAADSPFIYLIIRKEIFRNLSRYLIFHGGVSVRDGEALIVSGPPGSGKTTLTVEIVREGFEFFSDEFCPIDLATNRVHPFPRALGISGNASRRTGKTRLSPSKLGTPIGRRTAVPRCLILLDAGPSETVRRELKVYVRRDRLDRLVDSLPSGRIRVETHRGSVYCKLWVSSGESAEMKRMVHRALIQFKDAILDVSFSGATKPNFSRTPRIEKISAREAARLWLGDLIDRANPLVEDKPGAAFFRTSRILMQASCYRLIPGDLGRTKKLILSAWAAAGTE